MNGCSWWPLGVALLIGLLGLGSLTDVDTPPDFAPVPPPPVSVVNFEQIAADYPRVDGSTSTLPLAKFVACRVYGVPCIWGEFFGEPRWVSTDYTVEIDQAIADKINNLSHTTTHDAYVNLIENRTDLILVARLPSQEELELAEANGVEMDFRPVALDALVFVVNSANPIENLTLDQIRAVYTGQITDWSELDASSTVGVINAYRRDAQSGSQELIEALVMQDQTMIDLPDMMIPTMGGLISMINEDPQGLGYSVYYYATFIYPAEATALVPIEGVAPSSANIAVRDYPLIAEVYVGVRADMPTDSTAVMMRDWLLTPDGQATVIESGYVEVMPVNP